MEKGDTRPIIFLTGQASVSSTVHAMQAGAVDFLEKPVNANDLFSAVDRAVVLDQRTRDESAARRRSGSGTNDYPSANVKCFSS